MPATITEFIVGSCSHPECMGLKGAPRAPKTYPARSYLIESGSQRILCDTGYAPHFFQKAKGIYKLYAKVTPVTYDHDVEGLEAQLALKGLTRKDIDTVFVSHFHADHVAGLSLFGDSRKLVSEKALASIEDVSGIRALLKGHIPGLVGCSYFRLVEALPSIALPSSLKPFTHGYQLDEEGLVFAVPLPGHAAGHMGCFVHTETGWELLAFDAAWDPLAYTELRGPSELTFLIQHSRAEYYETLAKLRELHLSNIPIRLSHEPRIC